MKDHLNIIQDLQKRNRSLERSLKESRESNYCVVCGDGEEVICKICEDMLGV